MPARASLARSSRASRTGACARLDVEGHARRAGLDVRRRPAVGVVDHQVAVERLLGDLRPAPRRPAGRGSGSGRSGCPSRRRAASRPPATDSRGACRLAKSADRMLGEIWMLIGRASLTPQRRASASAEPAQQRHEHRVRPVPVRPQLEVRARARGRSQPAAVPARPPRPTSVARLTDGIDHPTGLGSRWGEQVTYATTPPGRAASSAEPSSARCSGTRSATSPGVRRQRDSGRRRSAPSPLHGTSTITRSNASGRQGGRMPSAQTTVAGSARSRAARLAPAARGAAAARPRPASRRARGPSP